MAAQTEQETPQLREDPIETPTIQGIIDDVTAAMKDFMSEEHITGSLTGKDRMRLLGAGVRNYGFCDKAYDIARDFPQFLPPFLEFSTMNVNMEKLEELRELLLTLEQFVHIASDSVLLAGDKCTHDALALYGSLKEADKHKVPGAEELHKALYSYYRRKKPRSGEEPIEPLGKQID